MAHVQQISSRSDVDDFFAKSPFFSVRFLLNTTVLVLCLGLDFLLMLKFWKLVAREPMYWVLLAPVWMLGSWLLVLQNHGRLRELYDAGIINEIESGSPLEASLEVAANALNSVLLYSFVANLVLLGAIFYLLRHS